MSVDRNKTVWQRVNDMLRGMGYSGRELDELQATVHKHVLAEREDAQRPRLTDYAISITPGPAPVTAVMSDREMYDHLGRKGMLS